MIRSYSGGRWGRKYRKDVRGLDVPRFTVESDVPNYLRTDHLPRT